MSKSRNRSLDTSSCVEHEDSQFVMLPRSSLSNNSGMFEYSRFATFEQSLFPSPPTTSPNPSFTFDPTYTSLGQSGATIPTSQQQYPYFLQRDFSHAFSDIRPCPRNRPSMPLNPFCGTMEPQIIVKQEGCSQPVSYHSFNDRIIATTTPWSPSLMASTTSSPSLSFTTNSDQYYSPPLWRQNYPTFTAADDLQSPASISDCMTDEEEGVYDKPYAQLIYEALLKAPGHRMLLRDIYDWFIQHTNKQRESGTNGWQNSIRHNLSMNKAFEIDKSDPASTQGARKANSVWVLTEHARKHGVQSTTRYRKNGASKKSTSNRAPAIQRQRSGAKGGRAARRAARLKRQEEGQGRATTIAPDSDNIFSQSFSRNQMSTPRDEWSNYSHSPATPAKDQVISSYYGLPHRSCYRSDQEAAPKYELGAFLDKDEHWRQILSPTASDEIYEDVARL